MKIAMLARNPNLYSHQRLQQAAEDRGHQLDILNTLRCTVHIASHKPEVFYNGEPCIGYDAVIPRIGASITNYGLAILRQFEMRGCWPLNESVAIGRSRDKLRSMQILAKHGLGLPLTAYANDPKQAEEIIKAVKGPPVVIKLLEQHTADGLRIHQHMPAHTCFAGQDRLLGGNFREDRQHVAPCREQAFDYPDRIVDERNASWKAGCGHWQLLTYASI